MKRSIELINAMESTEKEQWINEYERRLKQALSSRDHLKAAYNRGILDQVKNNRVKKS